MILHAHPLSSCCWKVLIALYEQGTPFEQRMVNLGDADARRGFEALWPTAKIPLLEDDGAVVPETSIIVEHLEIHHPGPKPLLPIDEPVRLRARLWDRLFDLYVMTPMQRFIAELLRSEGERHVRTQQEALAALASAYDLIEARLGADPWAAGADFTIADCAAAPALFYAAIVQPFPPSHATLSGYFDRLMDRPSVRRVIAEARPWFSYFPLVGDIPQRFLADS
nr:glutathione S-transferase family protein [Sphingosinicella sp. BN140058]